MTMPPPEPALTLTTALRAALPQDAERAAPALAELLSAVVSGEMTSEVAAARLAAEPALADAVRRLAGTRVSGSAGLISFGSGSQVGDVTISGVAGRDIVTRNGGDFAGAPILYLLRRNCWLACHTQSQRPRRTFDRLPLTGIARAQAANGSRSTHAARQAGASKGSGQYSTCSAIRPLRTVVKVIALAVTAPSVTATSVTAVSPATTSRSTRNCQRPAAG